MKIIRFILIIFFNIILLFNFEKAYCKTEKPTRTIKNLNGKSIQIPVDVRRVACFYGPSYEKVALLDAEDKIAVCSEFHKTLSPWKKKIFKRINNIPGYASSHSPNLEELINMKLDVVFFWDMPGVVEKIQGIGIPVIHPAGVPGRKVEDMKYLLNVYAEVLGDKAIKIAKRYSEYFDQKINMVKSVTSAMPDNEKPTVYFAVRKPLQTAGRDSFIPELVGLAGGISVQRDLSGGFGREIGLELLLKWNPEIIILDHCGARWMGSAPVHEIVSQMINDKRLESITALKNKQVYMSPTGVFFWDSGQQVILQIMWMAKMFHPEKFSHIDMNKELKYFYSEFFRYKLSDDEARRILLNLPPD